MAAMIVRHGFGLAWLLLLLCLLPLVPAQAQVQAQLDRSQLALGEVATLTISAEGSDASPDYAPLERDFLIYSPTMRRYSQMHNGRFDSRVEYVLGIQPRRAGQLQVPALQVGRHHTAPLSLTVTDAAVAGSAGSAPGAGPGLSFIRTRVDTASPWVHQSVGVVVALYYATQLSGGELVQDVPEHAGLQRVGDDRVDQAVVDGRHYNVVERRYLLLPERSGLLSLPPARFRGRAVGAGRGQLLVAEQDPPLQMRVQARPANAPDPWLPAHDLLLGWQVTPDRLEVGQDVELVLEAQVDGASRAQLDSLPLPADGPGYRLYPQATEVEERFDGDRPQLLLRRRVVVVAEQPGPLQLPAVQLDWWQVDSGQRRRTVQPAISVQVLPAGTARPAAAATAAALPAVAQTPQPAPVPARQSGMVWGLALLAMALGAGLLWYWRRRGAPATLQPLAATGKANLQQQLAQGGWQEIIDALQAITGTHDWPGLMGALADRQQQQVLHDAQRSWWGADSNDRVAVRAALRTAFARGPALHPAPASVPVQPLPPLYPP